MKKLVVKVFDFIAVIIGLLIGSFLSKNVGWEYILRMREDPVSLEQTEDGISEDFTGLLADDDIPRIENMQAWEDTWADVRCVTIEPISIISTNIAVRHPWISPYRYSRRGGRRKRPDVTYAILDVFDEYGEYYLLQLPDESYILAQIPANYAWKIKLGQKVTLPIGVKRSAHRQALSQIQEICEKYQVNTDEGVFYCIHDQWNEAHYNLLSAVRIAACFIAVIGIGSILITVFHKILKAEDE